jgi:FtsP/CotA-like multicopper oxidase with cupredoxin domain
VIVNERGSSTDINFINDLGTTASTNVLAYKYSTDQTLHWADPLAMDAASSNMCKMKAAAKGYTDAKGNAVSYPPPGDPCAQNYDGPIAAVPHLHGAEVPPQIDGGPEAWFTSDGKHFGSRYYTSGTPGNSALLKYPNTQEAGPLWFHDHTLGATRLNVYAGLAGGYYIEDPAITPVGTKTTAGVAGTCKAGCLPANLQPLSSVIPLVLQDRMFDSNGQLFFPGDTVGTLAALNPEHPYWVPEFMGDTIVVNGKAWPYLTVEPKRYRFLFLEGSNARPYNLSISNGNSPVTMWVIGNDVGYLDKPAATTQLLMLPGERYEVIIDFSGIKSGTNLVMKNDANAPYPFGDPVDPATTAQIIQFRVGACTSGACGADDKSYNPDKKGALLRFGSKAVVRLTNPKLGVMVVKPDVTRVLTLNEIAIDEARELVDPVTGKLTEYSGGPVEILVNNTSYSGMVADSGARPDFTGYTSNGQTINVSETPQEGQTEMWEIVNLTADAHPIHLHLTGFQLINRQPINDVAYEAAYGDAFGTGPVPLPKGCAVGNFCPDYGPPLKIDGSSPLSKGKLGGNIDIDTLGADSKPLYLSGSPTPPRAIEAGWKDTIIAPPGMVTRIAVRWAPTDLSISTPQAKLSYPFDPNAGGLFNYVWHCHIIDHEDNEMMRPDVILLNPKAPSPGNRPLVQGKDY